MSTRKDRPDHWDTLEDLIGDLVKFANNIGCAFCTNSFLNHGSGRRVVLENKVAPAGVQTDENGHPIAILCSDCANAGREPKFVHQVMEHGKGINTIDISQMADVQPKAEEEVQKQVKQVAIEEPNVDVADSVDHSGALTDVEEKKILEEFGEEQAEKVMNDPKIIAEEKEIDKERAEWAKKEKKNTEDLTTEDSH